MKRRTKGIIVAGFFAVILITSTLSIALNNTNKQNPLEKTTITGTPADNFPDSARPKFCGSADAKSNQYVTEYKIPTACTQPLAITTDPQGQVWFAQTNTGKVAKFDPTSKQFTEFDNPAWPEKNRSMMWGMDYSYDGSLWYTDDSHNAIWKFSTSDGSYTPISFPPSKESLPQHIKVAGNQLIINDFYGGKIGFYDTQQGGDQKTYKVIPTPIPGSFVAGFDVDSHGNIWYTNWILGQGGALVRFDYTQYAEAGSPQDNSTALQFTDAFNLPANLGTPIGLSIDQNDGIWIADTSSSSFFKFDPTSEKFTRYVTPIPRQSVYGNMTGVIKTPVSGPYWTQIDGGKLVFNEQIGNAIAVFDIQKESLAEYQIPSQNPEWADCNGQDNCGVSQAFGFHSAGDKIWFTEWVENNLGLVDLAKPLPVQLSVDQTNLAIPRGQSVQLNMQITSNADDVGLLSDVTSSFDDIVVDMHKSVSSGTQTVPVTITTSHSALSGTYKVLLSARADDVTVSQFVTVTIPQ